jgi:hypothetical protein
MGAVAKSYMSRPLVIYDFATAPAGFPYTGGNFFFSACGYLVFISYLVHAHYILKLSS